jgi:acylphosphatase
MAVERGVSGSVRNRPDGAVEAVFEGPSEAVESMLAFAREGPARADVTDVEVTDEEPEGLQGFTIA